MGYKYKFLLSSLKKKLRGQGRNCPSCGSNSCTKMDSKFLVLDLLGCLDCKLMFRSPTTSSIEFEKYYQKSYEEGFTTNLPNEAQLRELLKTNFIGTEKNYSTYINVLRKLGCLPGQSIFDFGCSWGYGSWQFRHAGFEVMAYDISKPRVAYAKEKLDINVVSDLTKINGQFDIFFSANVLEHISDPKSIFKMAFSLLKPDGIFLCFTPNGSDPLKQNTYSSWHKWWGFVHPNMIDDIYYDFQFKHSTRLFASSRYNYEEISSIYTISNNNKISYDLSGHELLFCAKKDRNLKYWDEIQFL